MSQCKANNRFGNPCASAALIGSDYCFFHDPSTAEDRKIATRKGGHARYGQSLAVTDSSPMEFYSMEDVIDLLTLAINDTLLLGNSATRNRTLGYLAGVLVTVFQVSDVEQRLLALEAKTLVVDSHVHP